MSTRSPSAARTNRRSARHEEIRRRRIRRRALAAGIALLGAGAAAALVAGLGDDDPTPTAAAESAAEVTVVSPAESVGIIDANASNPDFVLLDVRTPAEFAEGHIEGAVNLDVQDPGFASALQSLDPDAAYVVYCRSGNRSQVASAQMADAGFSDVYDIAGGVAAWTSAGLPLVV